MAIPLLRLLLVLVVASATMPRSSSLPRQCRFDYTSLALLSCQETAPQSPTRSCCDALLYAVDIWPLSDVDKGACCLCLYLVAWKATGAYVACGGEDARAVLAWKATGALSCDGPCSPNKPPPRGPPGGGGGSGRSGGARKHQAGLGLGVILAIVLGTLGVVGLLGWCIYRNCLSPAGKARRSPDPSNRGSDSAQEGLEMPRLSSARRSTSVLLD